MVEIDCMKNTLLITIGITFFLAACSGSGQEAGSVEAGFSLRPGESSTQVDGMDEPDEGVTEDHQADPEHKAGGHHHHANLTPANEMLAGEEFFDLLSHYESEARAEWQRPDDVITVLGDIENKVVMDLGAGSGYFAFRLKEAGAHVIAAEVDDRFIQYLHDRRDSMEIPDTEFDIRKVFFDDPLLDKEEVDVFFTVDTYHHIEHREDYLKKVYKGVKPGGQIVIIDFKKEKSPHGPPPSIRLHHEHTMSEVAMAGFSEVVVDTSTLPEQYILLALKSN